MSRVAQKVAVSLDAEIFARAERLRKESGESRSALVGRALRVLLRDEDKHREVERYVAAYRRNPERSRDEQVARMQARHALSALPWGEE